MELPNFRNWSAIVTAAAGILFALRKSLAFDALQLTPGMTTRIVFAAAETRSFKRATVVLNQVAGACVSDDT